MTTAARQHTGYIDVDPGELPSLGAGLRIVDVRERAEYEQELGHVPGARSVPLSELDAAAAAWARTDAVLLVCRSGRRSAAAAARLISAGFVRVFNLRGGMQAYAGAGLDVEHGPCRR